MDHLKIMEIGYLVANLSRILIGYLMEIPIVKNRSSDIRLTPLWTVSFIHSFSMLMTIHSSMITQIMSTTSMMYALKTQSKLISSTYGTFSQRTQVSAVKSTIPSEERQWSENSQELENLSYNQGSFSCSNKVGSSSLGMVITEWGSIRATISLIKLIHVL